MVEEQVLTHTQELAPPPYQVELVRDVDRFNLLGPEWDRLVAQYGIDRVFLSHTWFRTWWESFGSGKQLNIVTVRSGGELVAVAPLMRMDASIYGLKVAALHAIYNPHTPRYDFIVGANHDPRLYDAIWKELLNDTGSDLIVLTQVLEQSPTLKRMEQLAERDGWLSGRWFAPAAPFIPLSDGYEEFFKALKGSARYNLRKRYDRLMRRGPVDVEVVTDPAQVRQAMQEGLRIEAAAWKGAQGTAMLSDPAVAEFYTRLAEREADIRQLRLTFLRFNGKRIAFNYLIQSGQKLYAVKIGYDPQYHSYSPGNMLLNLILQNACEQGMEEYEFLGVDDAWKMEWTRERRSHQWLFLFKNHLRSRFLHYLKFSIVPAIKVGRKAICTYLPGRV